MVLSILINGLSSPRTPCAAAEGPDALSAPSGLKTWSMTSEKDEFVLQREFRMAVGGGENEPASSSGGNAWDPDPAWTVAGAATCGSCISGIEQD